ncbi:hypothetical protein CSHISOI_02714 [Colletotrichum shisoi]|uniref:Uncharacterized protein n=1 Tax=Colletotrichum shisoi TaxID=2078593 RepID=A0A5Q4C063_9PEZI|nr:hypothetical protein CSHISOI_02714 [Colletotrichum shisoi]
MFQPRSTYPIDSATIFPGPLLVDRTPFLIVVSHKPSQDSRSSWTMPPAGADKQRPERSLETNVDMVECFISRNLPPSKLRRPYPQGTGPSRLPLT